MQQLQRRREERSRKPKKSSEKRGSYGAEEDGTGGRVSFATVCWAPSRFLKNVVRLCWFFSSCHNMAGVTDGFLVFESNVTSLNSPLSDSEHWTGITVCDRKSVRVSVSVLCLSVRVSCEWCVWCAVACRVAVCRVCAAWCVACGACMMYCFLFSTFLLFSLFVVVLVI